MISLIKQAWNHKFFISVAFSDTSAARGISIRAFWPAFLAVAVVTFSALMFFIGETARAQLAARVAGDAEAAEYLSKIIDQEEKLSMQARQMDVLAQELGTLQSRIERFDVIGEKLVTDAELAELISSKDLENPNGVYGGGKGGPDTSLPVSDIDLGELMQQMQGLRTKADRAQLALETGLSLALMRQESSAGMPTHFPVIDDRIYLSSPYGWRTHPITKRRHLHSGMDIAGPRGAAIVAAGDGIVVYAGYRYAYGIFVEVRHANGFTTRYAHLSKATVTNGDQVNAGDLVGLMGSTGRSTGNHVHFEVLQGEEFLNPYPFVKQSRAAAKELAKSGHGKALVQKWKAEQAANRAAEKAAEEASQQAGLVVDEGSAS